MKIECLKIMWKLNMQGTGTQAFEPSGSFSMLDAGPQLIYFGIKPRTVLVINSMLFIVIINIYFESDIMNSL